MYENQQSVVVVNECFWLIFGFENSCGGFTKRLGYVNSAINNT